MVEDSWSNKTIAWLSMLRNCEHKAIGARLKYNIHMTNFFKVFSSKQVVLPVIHVEDLRQALKNADLAKRAGADGVFLISMRGMWSDDLLEIQRKVTKEFPAWWVGVNLLGEYTGNTFSKLDQNVSGLWSDNAWIDEKAEDQSRAEEINSARERSKWRGLYFGGVAFKYQRQVSDLSLAARIATRYMDVITTSGPGTGQAADFEKIATIKAGVGNFPVAIASGISPENVSIYREVADCYLVASSLLIPGTEDFDYYRVCDLVRSARG